MKILTESYGDAPYFKAYITNLGKYNEGDLIGEWVEFPIDEDDFEEVLKRIGISDQPDANGQIYEEWFVTDYECDLDAFNWQDLGEYPSYNDLQEFGELLESIDDVEAVNNAYEVTGDLQQAIDGLDNGDIQYYPGINSLTDMAYELVEQMGGVEELGKDTQENYFDYESLGRDIRLSQNAYETDEEDENGDPIYVNAAAYWTGDENASDEEIGEYYVDALGGIDQLADDDLENHFDYEAYGRDLGYEGFTITSDGCIEYR